jgi:hypothetical protein
MIEITVLNYAFLRFIFRFTFTDPSGSGTIKQFNKGANLTYNKMTAIKPKIEFFERE